MRPDLDHWLPRPTIRVAHRRESSADAARLWEAAGAIRLSDTALLGRLVRLRIPGIPRDISFDQLFRHPPFTVLDEQEGALVSGLVGRIWTLRRDYPQLSSPEGFRSWSTSGTARVMFANWVEPGRGESATLHSESRVEPIGVQGRLGLAAVRPLVRGFQHLVASEAMEAALRQAEGR